MADSLAPLALPPPLRDFCARELSPPELRALADGLAAIPPSDGAVLLELLGELAEGPARPAAAAFRQLPAVLRLIGPAPAALWVDLGVALSSRSSASSLKYFTESPEIFLHVSPTRIPRLLRFGLELTDGPYGVVMDLLRSFPQLPPELGEETIGRWMQAGMDLAEEDTVLGVEYFRISPQVLGYLAGDDLDVWIRLGRGLVETNVLGKPDYLKVIEYFRLSLETFSALDPPDLRRPFLDLGARLVGDSPAHAMDFIRQGPAVLKHIPSPAHRRLYLQQALRLSAAVGADPALLMDFLREGPVMFFELENKPDDFAAWVETGLALLAENPERARAYFSRRSKTGQETTERLMGGVALKGVSRVLSLYAEGLCGRPVAVRSTADLPESVRPALGNSPATDGRTLYLPPRIRIFPSERDNFMVYKVSTLHEAGHLEFGTYDPPAEEVRALAETLPAEFGRADTPSRPAETVGEFLRGFPDPEWARFLWTVLEDARVDEKIRREYPGIQGDMDRLVELDLQARPALEGLPPRAALREALLQLSLTDTTETPLELAETVTGAYRFLQEIKKPGARSPDSLRLLIRLYRYLEEALSRFPPVKGESDPLGARESSVEEPAASPPESGGQKAAPAGASFRGEMNPDWVEERLKEGGSPAESLRSRPPSPAAAEESRDGSAQKILREDRPSDHAEETAHQAAQGSPSPGRGTAPASEETTAYYYDEWDAGPREYRPKWCRLVEHHLPLDSGRMAEETLAHYRPVLGLLRRHFQAMRPETDRKVKRQAQGEEFDLDAVVEARTEIRSGRIPHDRLYIRREKRIRDVAAAFLVDMSGSTSRTIPSAKRRVIEIEQEALVLMAEALQAVGDRFGIFGFSGRSKDQVDYFVVKDFTDPFTPAVHQRIGAMRPLDQNRDGAAIRHTVSKLGVLAAKTRLLILLSDGKPLDGDYAGAYSLQDTKAALQEAKRAGIHPYCITIDQEASRYVAEMFGEVSHTIIDRVATLPDRLPRIYRRLTT